MPQSCKTNLIQSHMINITFLNLETRTLLPGYLSDSYEKNMFDANP